MSYFCSASDAADMCSAVSSNPDISGIGVRTALYTQTILSMISASLMPNNNIAFRDSSRTTYVVSCALIASSVGQWKHGGLSFFDGIMSTMLTSLMTIFVTVNYSYIQTLGVSIQIASLLFTSFWSYWGIQVWSDPSTFGLEPPPPTEDLSGGASLASRSLDISNCTANANTVFVVFGRSIPATNNGIRIFALLVFSAGGIMSLVALWHVLVNIYHYFRWGAANTKEYNVEATVLQEEYGDEYGIGTGGGGKTRVARLGGFIGLSALIYLIVTTEQMVLRNPDVIDDLSQWTFGQTLGVIMIIQQLIDIWHCWIKRNEFKIKWSDLERAG